MLVIKVKLSKRGISIQPRELNCDESAELRVLRKLLRVGIFRVAVEDDINSLIPSAGGSSSLKRLWLTEVTLKRAAEAWVASQRPTTLGNAEARRVLVENGVRISVLVRV